MNTEKKRRRKPKSVKLSAVTDLLTYIDNIPEKEDPEIPLSYALEKMKDGIKKLIDKGFSHSQIANFLSSSFGLKISENDIVKTVGNYQKYNKTYPIELLEVNYKSLKYLDSPTNNLEKDHNPVIDVQPIDHDSTNNQSNIDKLPEDNSANKNQSLADRNKNKNRSGAGYIDVKPDNTEI